MRSNTGRPSAVIVFRTFRPSWISVICLEKLRNLSLGPMTLFQRPICVSIRLRWLYPVATLLHGSSFGMIHATRSTLQLLDIHGSSYDILDLLEIGFHGGVARYNN